MKLVTISEKQFREAVINAGYEPDLALNLEKQIFNNIDKTETLKTIEFQATLTIKSDDVSDNNDQADSRWDEVYRLFRVDIEKILHAFVKGKNFKTYSIGSGFKTRTIDADDMVDEFASN